MPPLLSPAVVRSFAFPTRRLFSSISSRKSDSQASGPGWGGKPTDDHVVNRTDENDVQSQASQSGMRKHEAGEEGSQGLSGKDEGGHNKQAEKDHPEAPQPVIGMNDERGQKGHSKESDVKTP